jgi:hypothetical protein
MSSGPGPRPSRSSNHAYEAEETPLLKASPDFWWMNEADRSNAFEARALAYGGQGYRCHPERSRERER